MRLRLLLPVSLYLIACPAPPEPPPPPPPPPTTELSCDDGIDEDGDGLLDCDDPDCASDAACLPPPPEPCEAQADCGDFKWICLARQCVPPGAFHPRTGEPEQVALAIEATFDEVLSDEVRRPASVLLRLLDSRLTDGTTLTCDALIDPETRTAEDALALDADVRLNHLWRQAAALTWSAQSTFDIEAAEVSRGANLLLFAEAFSGALEEDDPTGDRAAVTCIDGLSLADGEGPFTIPVELRGEAICSDLVDDDGDGLIDCDDPDCAENTVCLPPTGPSCSSQKDCGDIVEERVIRACLGEQCITPGPRDENGEALLIEGQLTTRFDPRFSLMSEHAKPKSLIIRLVYPELTDGTPLTCEALKARAGTTHETRTQLEDDQELNQIFRSLMPLSWSGGGSGGQVFHFPLEVPRGRGYLLYGEAWFGVRELNLPKGNLASSDCKVLPDLSTAPDGVELDLYFEAP